VLGPELIDIETLDRGCVGPRTDVCTVKKTLLFLQGREIR
jgi:hypothetical protein